MEIQAKHQSKSESGRRNVQKKTTWGGGIVAKKKALFSSFKIHRDQKVAKNIYKKEKKT